MVDTLRWGAETDEDAIRDVIRAAFGRDVWHGSPERFRVLERDGRIVSVARISPVELQVGKCSFVKGDVGEVSTHPEYQGRGLGSALMQDVVGALREGGCHVSRLGGLLGFYSRFGWAPFPRRYIDFPLRETKAGADTLRPDEFLALPDDFPGTVRPFDPVSDHDARVRLYKRFNRRRTGAEVRRFGPAPAERPAELNPLHCVCEMGGEVRAYAFATEYPEQVSEFEAKVTIHEVAYDFDEPRALEGILRHLLVEAYRRGARRATARLPFDERVFAAMTNAGIGYQAFEIRSAPAGNMMQIIDLRGLLERIVPELESRLAASPCREWRGRLAMEVRNERVALCADGGGLTVEDARNPDPLIRLGQYEMLSMVLGLTSVAQLLSPDATDIPHQVLDALFPAQPTASGPWG